MLLAMAGLAIFKSHGTSFFEMDAMVFVADSYHLSGSRTERITFGLVKQLIVKSEDATLITLACGKATMSSL